MNWQLFGLSPNVMPSFFKNCDNPATSNDPNIQVPCPGHCVQYLMAYNTKTPAQTDSLVQFTLRGCSTTLSLPSSPHVKPEGTATSYCETDLGLKKNLVLGNPPVSLRVYLRYCYGNNTEKSCNTELNADFDTAVKNCPPTNLNLRKCYECQSTDRDCAENDSVKKRYCMKTKVAVGNSYVVHKISSNVNPFGVNQYCESDYKGNSMLAGSIISSDTVSTCYCQDKDYCNGASLASVLMALKIALIALFVR
ncbi:hypothetical protein L596_005618 [Steinernema carpocapsae]|uniref:Uncharacterized protein n=1 Tax=Steinernema carpocapsae TaxID=34508 RepID=A0A4U8UZN6_STECR|nr:hypothetical protein L596_005618 [Steinernema carpocapsae]